MVAQIFASFKEVVFMKTGLVLGWLCKYVNELYKSRNQQSDEFEKFC